MARIRVAVLMGGRSAEREVSLSTGRQVLAALDPSRYEAFPVDPACFPLPQLAGPAGSVRPWHYSAPSDPVRAEVDLEGPPHLPVPAAFSLAGARRPDVALLCLHGKYGEDGTIQGLLELFDIPYTGSGVLASALAMDKVMSKRMFRASAIPTPPDATIRQRAEIPELIAAVRSGTPGRDGTVLACPLIVKPSQQGSTIGVTIVQEVGQLGPALETALEYDQEALVERFIAGTEITVPILGNNPPQCLPIVEIVPTGGFYDYAAKYTPGATDEIVPARISDELAEQARDLALRSHAALGCRGFSRTDMIVEGDQIWVLEVNTIPGMTPTSLLPRSAEAAGISFPELLDRMLALALERRTHGSPAVVA
ncbi:MAG: D-alanine--D-alanine ligase [Armatimonadetes bacterium]|nr:D-alanine--D-alanine ligase [Armatimonadota bacterium]